MSLNPSLNSKFSPALAEALRSELLREGIVSTSGNASTPDSAGTKAGSAVLGTDTPEQAEKYYIPEVYSAERDITITRQRSGAQELKKLKPVHKRIISLHLAGNTGVAIAKMVGMAVPYITWVLKSAIVQEVIQQYDSMQDAEFKRLRRQADDNLREALFCDSRSARLKATELFFKREDILDQRNGGSGLTAEDVARKLLEQVSISNSNVQINLNLNTEKQFSTDLLGDGA